MHLTKNIKRRNNDNNCDIVIYIQISNINIL